MRGRSEFAEKRVIKAMNEKAMKSEVRMIRITNGIIHN